MLSGVAIDFKLISALRTSCVTLSQQLHKTRTIGSAVEHHIDIVGVTGSIPVSSTLMPDGTDV